MAQRLLKNILIVDDEESYRSMIQRSLETKGYVCSVAADASEALNVLQAHRTDLVISDVDMPGMDGIELMREARKIRQDLDFVLITGHGSDYHYGDMISAGAADFIIKPFKIGELEAKLERIAGEKRVLRQFHQTMEELRHTKDYLENVLENSAEVVGIVDKNGKAIIWNRAAVRTYGYTLDDLAGRSVFELYADQKKLGQMLSQLRKNGFVRRYEMDMKKKNGEIAPFEVSISLLRNHENKVIGSVCVAMDLSDLKKALSELERTNEKLHAEVAERKQAEEKLRKARDQLTMLVEERNARLSKAGALLKRSIDRFKDITQD